MFDDSHLFDDFKPTTGEKEADVLLRIEKKLDKLIDLMSKNTSIPTFIPSKVCSRYNYKGMVDGECIFEDEYGHRVTETELKRYQEIMMNLWNDSVDDVYDKERFWNKPTKKEKSVYEEVGYCP